MSMPLYGLTAEDFIGKKEEKRSKIIVGNPACRQTGRYKVEIANDIKELVERKDEIKKLY